MEEHITGKVVEGLVDKLALKNQENAKRTNVERRDEKDDDMEARETADDMENELEAAVNLPPFSQAEAEKLDAEGKNGEAKKTKDDQKASEVELVAKVIPAVEGKADEIAVEGTDVEANEAMEEKKYSGVELIKKVMPNDEAEVEY